ncbi:TPA: nuclear transport factor 2 family protein [Stenotrophomonas maltophilia]|nr:nuclear transport factor 2 family protein [Stenotrophomonas maltophilia]
MFKSVTTALILSVATAATAQEQQAARTAVDVPRAFERHFNAQDLDGMATLYDKDSIFVSSPGIALTDITEIRSALAQFMASKMPISLTIRHVYESNDTALIVFDWVMAGSDENGNPARLSGTGADVVRRRADGMWIYAIDNPFGVASAQ